MGLWLEKLPPILTALEEKLSENGEISLDLIGWNLEMGFLRGWWRSVSRVKEDIILSDQGEWHRKEEERRYIMMWSN